MFKHQKMGKLLEKEFFLFLSIKKLKKIPLLALA